MDKYEFNATGLIAEAFEQRDLEFYVVNHDGVEQLLVGFPIDCGPSVIVRFISSDNDNDVAARIYGLLTGIPEEKRVRIMEACNSLNLKIRYLKFYLNRNDDINVEYDFPMQTPDDKIGEMAFEIFIRMMHILNSEYSIFMKALYSDEDLDAPESRISAELLQELSEFSKMMREQMDVDALFTDEETEEESQ